MKYFLFTLLLSGTLITTAQSQLNSYKYVIVPKNFDAFKKENQYQTSTLVKYLLVQNGLNAVYDDELPEDLNSNRCLGLSVDLLDESSMFSTKVTALFKDCKSVEVYRTQQGTSKEKEFKSAYNEAMRMAFKSLNGFQYSYNDKKADGPVTVNFRNDVQKLDKTETDSRAAADAKAVEQQATPKVQRYKNREPLPSDIVKKEPEGNGDQSMAVASDTWYAQEIPNGYQLVDNTPKVRLKILKTSLPEVFLAVGDNANGLLYREGTRWIWEYYQGNERRTQEIRVKF